jgi:hypothetical protein
VGLLSFEGLKTGKTGKTVGAWILAKTAGTDSVEYWLVHNSVDVKTQIRKVTINDVVSHW